jgi:cytochrome c-type biogenesis protein CcmE
MKRFKTRYVVAVVVCLGAVGWMITNLGSNLNYMESVSTALHQRETNGTSPEKVGGVVKPGTIDKTARTGATFQMSDGKQSVKVRVEDTPPSMFTDCIAVVLTGAHWSGDTLVGSRLEVKHGSTYSTKKMQTNVDTALDATGCPRADKA